MKTPSALEYLGIALLSVSCGAAHQRGVVALPPGGAPSIPGPMPDFGPFPTHSDALLAACPKILSFNNAVATRPITPHLRRFRNVPKEYCAWIYATPQGQYEMSLVAMSASQNVTRCRLPDHVLDARFVPESLGYIFAVHNHPLGSALSEQDIGFIVEEAQIHGLTARVQDKEIELGVAAFFSHDVKGESPSCDGFYLYQPKTGEVLKWTPSVQGVWSKTVYARVILSEKPNSSGFNIQIEQTEQ